MTFISLDLLFQRLNTIAKYETFTIVVGSTTNLYGSTV